MCVRDLTRDTVFEIVADIKQLCSKILQVTDGLTERAEDLLRNVFGR
jgi:hypothetical protein